MRNNQMPTTITIDQHQSPTSSRSASRSGTISEEEFSSGTGEHIPSGSGSYDLSDPLDETWDYIPDDHEIEPSESASRPRTSRRPPPASRPTRRHTATERSARHPPVARVRHVHVAPPSSVEPDDYPGYGRGYPGQYGGRMPQPPPGYAPSAYSVAPGGGGPYAPPFGNPGALTHYGQQGGYQYPGGNPFSPQPPPPGPGGAGYFNGGGHHAMSTHGTPSPYGGHEMMQYPPMPGYGAYSGYPPPPPPPNMSPHMQFYPPQWSPPSDHSNVGPDPEVEKKLLAIEELMKNQKIDFEKAQKELAARDAADAAKIKAAEAAAAAAAAAAAEKAAWEKKLAEEKKAAAAQGAENAKKQIEAEKKKAEQAAADEKEKADAKAAVAKAEADSKAAIEKAEKERKEAIEKSEKEAKEAVAKAEKEAKEAVEKAEKEAKEAVEKAAKEAKESIDKALAPTADTRKPIKFKDAVGRKFSFPFHLCETWGGMEELIKQAFVHVDQFSQHVAEGHYDLIGPNGEIILPQVWDTMIEPDWNVTMMMWPIPEKPPPPGPPPFHGGRPSSRHHGGRPPGPPPPHHRGAAPPPPPPGWGPGGPPRPPGPGGGGPGPGPGGPPIVVVPNGSGAPRVTRRKTEPAKGGGMLGWMAGKPAKPSGKGPKKAEPYNACLVM